MRIITSEQISNLGITPSQCVKWVKEAFLMKRQCQLPPKISIHPQGTDFINTMPCLLPPEYHTFGCKVVSRINGCHPALKSDMMLIDSGTGEFRALINCDWITAMRTGAVAALAINTLRSTDASVYSFIGLGVIGKATLKCLIETNQDIMLNIRLMRYKHQAEQVINEFSHYDNVRFSISNDIRAFVEDSDVIVSCITDAKGILVDDVNLFKAGVLVVPVHTRGFQNCDTIFDKVFADDEGHVKGFKYFNQFRRFGEIGDVLAGRISGRENDNERILSYNIGLGLHDVWYGTKIMEKLQLQITPPINGLVYSLLQWQCRRIA